MKSVKCVVAGVSDRVKQMVAFRRVGWKVKAHGESVAGSGNREGIMRCSISLSVQSMATKCLLSYDSVAIPNSVT